MSPGVCYHPGGPIFLRLNDDATNRIFSYSNDGENYEALFTEPRTTSLTADQVGFAVNVNNSTRGTLMNLLHWAQS